MNPLPPTAGPPATESTRTLPAGALEVLDLEQKLELFDDIWNPRLLAELNGQHVKLAKLQGEFVWHAHDREDELFLVLRGELEMQMRDRTVTLQPGQIFVVPRGVEHRPVAHREVHVLLFEPAGTINTGDSDDVDLRRDRLEQI